MAHSHRGRALGVLLGALAACAATPLAAHADSGVLTGGTYENAKVCLDTDDNAICDPGELWTRSSRQGTFKLNGNGAHLTAEIGTDARLHDLVSQLDSPVVSRIVLRAPRQAPGFVGFHSTAVLAEMETHGLAFYAAVVKVAQAVGVPPDRLLVDIELETDPAIHAALRRSSEEGIARIQKALAALPKGGDVREAIAGAALVDRRGRD